MYNWEITLSGLNFLRLCNNKLIQPVYLNRFGKPVSSWQFIVYCAFFNYFPVILLVLCAVCDNNARHYSEGKLRLKIIKFKVK